VIIIPVDYGALVVLAIAMDSRKKNEGIFVIQGSQTAEK